MSDPTRYDIDLGPFCSFKAYYRRGKKRPGQWAWRARYRRSQRWFAAWNAANYRASIRAATAAAGGSRATKRKPDRLRLATKETP